MNSRESYNRPGHVPVCLRTCAGSILLAFCAVACSAQVWCQTGKRYDVPPEGDTEVLPFASYDTDAGLGLGMKAFALNHLRQKESFDVTLFWSTKGERWVRAVFSMQDFELRQREEYPLAVDAVIDYDKWISYKFFGTGNTSSYDSSESYTRDALELSVLLSRGFSPQFVGTVGLRYRWLQNSGYDPSGRLVRVPSPESRGVASALGLVLSVRYDSRDSYIHPTSGLVLVAETEFAPPWSPGNTAVYRTLGSVSWYGTVTPLGLIIATRVYLEGVGGPNLPVQTLVGVGGTRSVRGSTQDRYVDRIAGVANLELRFPLFWRIGAVAGMDAGKVWPSLAEIDLTRWAVNPVVGLRLYMDTFVVRADAGFGRETTGIYLNFGHLF